MWEDVAKILGTSAILVFAVTWLVKKVFIRHIEHLYGRKFEAFRKELEKSILEHQIRFSKLHEIRAKVLAELYRFLVSAEGAVGNVVTPIGYEGQDSLEDRAKYAWKSIVDFNNYLLEHEIYLEPKLCEPIHKILHEMKSLVIRSGRIKDDPKVWIDLISKFETAVKPAKQKIANYFRNILGISE